MDFLGPNFGSFLQCLDFKRSIWTYWVSFGQFLDHFCCTIEKNYKRPNKSYPFDVHCYFSELANSWLVGQQNKLS